jgi:peptidoglycan hydrolase-like protein with peptidoglycan-binding domain
MLQTMIKKLLSILIIGSFIIISPISVSAERLIETPALFTDNNAPHSAKPVTKKKSAKKVAKRNLKLGMKGSDVLALQKFLIKKSTGNAAKALAKNGASSSFGALTKEALIEYQKANKMTADGVAGAKVRAKYS